MVDQVKICGALKKLRASKPEFRSYARFTKESGIHRPTVESTENGLSLPSVETIEKWVTACGTSLPKFFQQFEDRDAPDVKILPGYEGEYRLLTEIFESGQDLYISGIHANLVGMSIAAKVESGNKATAEQAGNVAPKERRKTGSE